MDMTMGKLTNEYCWSHYSLLVLGLSCMGLALTCILYKFKSKVTATTASLSYAIYLIHKITIHLTQVYFSKLNIEKDSNLMFAICIVTSLSGAVIINKLVEKPFLRLRKKVLVNPN